jgi:hypothetical protein
MGEIINQITLENPRQVKPGQEVTHDFRSVDPLRTNGTGSYHFLQQLRKVEIGWQILEISCLVWPNFSFPQYKYTRCRSMCAICFAKNLEASITQ